MSDDGYGPVTVFMVERLRETRPWVRLVAILGFVGAGLMLVGALAMLVIGAMDGSEFGFGGGLAIALIYLLGGFIYLVTSRHLYRYASSIDGLLRTRETTCLEQALEHQKSFWRIVGIISMVYIAILGVGLLFVLIGTLLAL